MKYILIIGDGMADEPNEAYNGLTPLQAANKPNIDWLTKHGRSGRLKTVPDSLSPGSAVANMGILGYDVEAVFEGRGPLEAAAMGIKLQSSEMAMRCNLITVEEGLIKNHSAGHISTEEACELIQCLEMQLGNETARLYPGVSYRHLMVVRGGNKRLHLVPPHDHIGEPFTDYLPKAETETAETTANLLREFTLRSHSILKEHPVNLRRIRKGLSPANSVWLWAAGYKPEMPTLKEMYGIKSAAVISAVDLIKGIGIYAGMAVISVDGATGNYDTNYKGKAEAAVEALESSDFVYLHIEAPDEAGHEGDFDLKKRTIEDIDRFVVKHIIEKTVELKDNVTIAFLPDHPTPCKLKTHTRTPVPFSIYSPGASPDMVDTYDEESVLKGAVGLLKGSQFMRNLLAIQ